MPSNSTAPRVVVADDSALMRSIVSSSLMRKGVQIVGSAKDGDEALALCEREQPDAMTLDLAMPGLDGIGVLKALRKLDPTHPGRTLPVVVVSAFSPSQGARAVDALAEGAFDLVPKPTAGTNIEAFTDEVHAKLQAAIASKVHVRGAAASRVQHRADRPSPRVSARATTTRVLVIATSTGGPKALAGLIPRLPSPLGMGTLIVQHMPAGFTSSLAARLDAASQLTVREAQGGEILDPRTALIAPGGKHLRLSADGRTRLEETPPIGGLRPRADLTIEDAAKLYKERLVLAVLTGMGADGKAGAEVVKHFGGTVLAEHEKTCTVYGMPRAVADAGLVDAVHPLDEMAAAIAQEVRT